MMETKRYFHNLQLESNGKQPQSLPVMYTEQYSEGNEGGIELNKLFMALRRRALVIASVTTAVTTAVIAYSIVSKPIYQAKFQLLVKPVTIENKLSASPLKQENQSTEGVGETELRILQSPKLMSPIIKQVEAQYPGSDAPKLSFTLVPKTNNIIEVSFQDLNPDKVKLVLDTAAQTYLMYSLEERRSDVRQGIQFVEAQLPQLQKQVEKLQEQLQQFRQKYSLIDPEGQSKQLSSQLDGIVQQRLDTQAQLAKTRALNASLQKQLKLQSNEATVASSLSEAPRYQELLNKLQEVRTKIAVELARYQEGSPIIQDLRSQEQNLLPLIEQERQNVLGNQLSSKVVQSGSLASPNSIRQQQTQQFFDTANQVQALEAQNKALVQAESILRQQFQQFPLLVRQNDDLERQLKIAVDNLNQFLTTREALRIDIAQKQVPWQLLTPPTKPQSAEIGIKHSLALGVAFGLLLGMGAALVADKFDNLFYTTEDVKDITRLPLLGEITFKPEKRFSLGADVINLIPFIGNKSGLGKRGKLSQPDNSQFWESLRSLYTNIRFLSFDSPIRSLAIISAASEDGRSTIAVHLAQTAAAMGKRVLLVDADLRSPKIHKMLDLPNTKGLSNVIAANLDFRSVIQQVNCVSAKTEDNKSLEAARQIEELPLENTLFVLTAGQVPPNPASLLSSPKMHNLAAEFQAAFDLIIYDTSPLLGLADSSLLATHADASILVVGLGKTDRSALAKGLEGLKISATPILGVVANGVKVNAAA